MVNALRNYKHINNWLIGLSITIAVATSLFVLHANLRLVEDYAAVTESYAVSSKIEALLSHITDGETAERGYLITGQDIYLEPYYEFKNNIDDDFGKLMAENADDEFQQKQLKRLLPLIDARRQELEKMILARRESDVDFLRTAAGFGDGKAIHDQIRQIVAIMTTHEQEEIIQRNINVKKATQLAKTATLLVIFIFAGFGCAILFTSKLERKRIQLVESALRETNEARQKLQQQLVQNVELLSRVGELASVGGWELDLTTQAVNWSTEVYRIHEIDPADRPDLANAYAFYPEGTRASVQAAVENAIATGTGWDFEWPFVTAKGRHLWVRSIGSVVTEGGKAVRLHGAFQDITARKKIDETLVDMNRQLAQERDRAESASNAKSQFLANMSHEIRTPMNAILGMVQLLGQTELTSRQYDYVEKTERAAKSLLGILNDILDFSKIEAGKLTLELEPFSLDKLIRDLAVIFSTNIGKKDVEALINLDAQLPLNIKGDALRLQQVLINLTGNAIKFTEKGEILLSLTLARLTATHVTVDFAISDTGIGIAPEHLTSIFEGFSQGESSTTRRFGGTGLGLAISKNLVQLMGGELTVESEVGVGSRFFFTLTFEINPSERLMRDNYLMSSIPGMTRDKKLRALVVDDNEMARDVIQAMIQSLGWHCDSADCGPEALDMIRKNLTQHLTYDVVFMDWKMPDMDGWQATMQIRDIYVGGSTPIIILVSAHGRQLLAERLRNEPTNLDGFLVKPVTASMLFDAVADAKAGVASFTASTVRRPESSRLKGLRLLVVEDNMMNQQVARELLAGEGAHITVASNGREGVKETLETQPPYDAVLMDIQMPDMDGFTATAEIRRHTRLQMLPIIAMTANAMVSDKHACLAAGMNDHVAKPIDLEILVNTLLKYCKVSADGGHNPSRNEASDSSVIHPNNDQLHKALRRLGGNQKLFMSMTTNFADNMPNLAQQLRDRFGEQKIPESVMLLHTMKGIAGTLGAMDLSQICAQAELQLRVNPETELTETWFEQLDALIHTSCETLLEFSSTFIASLTADVKIDYGANKPSYAQTLNELLVLLEHKNMRALIVFEELKSNFGASLEDKLAPLEDALNKLEFFTAHDEARKLRDMLQWP